MRYALHLDMFEATLTCSRDPNCFSFNCALKQDACGTQQAYFG